MTDRTRDYTVKSGRFGKSVDGEHKMFGKGDTISLTDAEAKNLGNRVELASMQGQYEPLSSTIKKAQGIISKDSSEASDSKQQAGGRTSDESGDDSGSDEVDSQDWSATLDGMKWNEAVDLINSLETEEDITAAREAEAKGLKRKSVLEAADARLT